MKPDRLFEFRGTRFGLFFASKTRATVQALEASGSLELIEIDVESLSAKDVIGKILRGLGESAA